jgi:hypothetical protein
MRWSRAFISLPLIAFLYGSGFSLRPSRALADDHVVQGTVRQKLEDRGLLLKPVEIRSDSAGYIVEFVLTGSGIRQVPFREAILQGGQDDRVVVTAHATFRKQGDDQPSDIVLDKDHSFNASLPINVITGIYSQVVVKVIRPGESDSYFLITDFDEQIREGMKHSEYFFPHDD